VKLTFTKARLDALPAPESGRRYDYDSKVSGLTLCTTAAGCKTFYYCRRVNGPYQRIVIGRYPDVAIEQARREAAKLAGQIASGANPQDRKRAARREMTFGDLFADYLDRHAKPHKKSWEQDQKQFDRYLKPLAGRKASAITQADVQRLHAGIGNKGRYSANRALALVSVVFSRCAAHLPNPAKGIRRFKEQSRDRFLHADELRAFFKALEAEPSGDWRDFFVVSLLTGARRSNVLAMRWADVNLDRGLWRIPETESKNGEPLICVLVGSAVEILRRRFAEIDGASPFAFPGVGKNGHLAEPKKAWHGILERAGLLNADGKNTVRIHDLRRTLGSWQAAGGASLSIIGRALGHKNVATTAVYARLDVDPVRQSLESATQAMLTAGESKMSRRALPPAKGT